MQVIGTAGHVDHGKSSLVKALTGIDPDRLAEEKAREMTIDLGFAWLALGAGEVGIVDVPGHRDFIENMLAGVSGISLALLVVAADEGVMPQTREHLAILDLLAVRRGVVALTKVDLILQEQSSFGLDWLDLISLEVSEALDGTVLAAGSPTTPIIPVSARTGYGLESLKDALRSQLELASPPVDDGRSRLPVDRVFSLPGFGTVVTGTLAGGALQLGEVVEVQPSGVRGRIRGLQTHRSKLEIALPGSRVAVNLSGVTKDDIKRGDVVARQGVVRPTRLLDASYRHLADTALPFQHNTEVKLFTGASELIATARVLGAAQIEPGEQGWLQLALRQPGAVLRGDRFILRRPSPGETLGGGQVVDPQPGRRHRRFRSEIVTRLEILAQGTPGEQLLAKLARIEPVTVEELFKQAGLDLPGSLQGNARTAWEELVANGHVLTAKAPATAEEFVMSSLGWRRLLQRLEDVLGDYHRDFPLRSGMPREELRSRLALPTATFNAIVHRAIEQKAIAVGNPPSPRGSGPWPNSNSGPNSSSGPGTPELGTVRPNLPEAEGGLASWRSAPWGLPLHLTGHTIHFSAAQQKTIDELLSQFDRAGINSPSVKESRAAVGAEIYFALMELGILQPVSDEVVYRMADYLGFVARIHDYLGANGRINAAQVRDLFQTSRKYAIALLEHMDQQKITRRVGDDRELRAVATTGSVGAAQAGAQSPA